MSKIKRGVFLADLHLPYSINLDGVFEYLRDFKPQTVILGGDIIDADHMHGVDGFTIDKIEREVVGPKGYYARDRKLIQDFVDRLQKSVKNAECVFLEGNHEERYQRIAKRYPESFKGKFDFKRDALPEKFKWVPYGNYDSFYRVGDTLFTHGTLYPELHSKKYAYFYSPDKVVYGHIHDFQAFTIHRGDPRKPTKYALTGGCLCKLTPEYKKGAPHKWTNGFISFIEQNGIVTPTVHIIEEHGFTVGTKSYRGAK